MGSECVEGRCNVVRGWGGEHWERVDEKGQKESLGGRTMDCSTGQGGKVKGVRIGIRK
jgi:hypothetical protein